MQVLLDQYQRVNTDCGKLVVFDEAHKYVSEKQDALVKSIITTVRQMRHLGIRVAISTQSPTVLPPELLELSTVALLHRFHSKDWISYLSSKLPLPDDAFETVMGLQPGQALLFATPLRLSGQASSRTALIQIRKRITSDAGRSVTNG